MLLIAILGLLLASVSAKQNEKFDIRVSEEGARFTQKVELDEENNLEKFEVPQHNNIDGSRVIHDFNRNLTLRLTKGKCFLSDLSKQIEEGTAVEPKVMSAAIKYAQVRPSRRRVPMLLNDWAIGQRVEDDVDLGPEMREMCEGRAIYWLILLSDTATVAAQPDEEPDVPRWSPRHRRQLSPSCGVADLKYRCKMETINCAYIYYLNCEAERVSTSRRSAHCVDEHNMHVVDTAKCCRECCAKETLADEFFPFCDTLNDFTCTG